MEISPVLVYVWLQVDSIKFLTGMLSPIFGFFFVFLKVISYSLLWEKDEKEREKCIAAYTRWGLRGKSNVTMILLILCITISTFTPNSKTIAAMWAIPAGIETAKNVATSVKNSGIPKKLITYLESKLEVE